ncbi:MAG: tRNA (adenosine(37)-N6)-threonylcarbamoyltransferase complex ATPase subunit type 1 TsaE [Holosporales bacterium]|jgi:tRNA threonylcarbamoyladenosine biosynthesis protein TsaE|nr:tRNA (adenosine(37)-N6)-threonylcarbamoyltransferase complex ATPase subunit type 1 TsaE [Holosporales bacterium]
MAEGLAARTSPPFSFFLSGEVGTGKTTFSQFFISSILIDKNQNITSPTFNIVQIYETIKGPVWHVDLYRIKNAEEICDLGLFEAMGEFICLIEWPNLVMNADSQYVYKEIRF